MYFKWVYGVWCFVMYWKYWEVLFWFEEGEFWVKIGNGRFLEVDGWYYMEKLLVKRYCE